MPRALTLLGLAITIISREQIVAATPEKSMVSVRGVSEKEARALAIYATSPRYPLEARMKHYAGSGLASLKVDPRTGIVTSARMLESTGWGALDNAALDAFRQWRFKPGSLSAVRIPVTFGHLRQRRRWWDAAMYGPQPDYPRAARAKGLTGSGVVLVKIDPRTGSVVSASMLKSTGHEILDDAALRAFRQWRFKPSALTTIEIPIEFTSEGALY